jgi:integrase
MPRIAENRRNLTKELVARIKPQASKFIVWDETIPNLGLRVYPSGTKAYVLRLSFTDAKGKTAQRMETVGAAEDFKTPEFARKAALQLRQRYKAGEDVKATKRAVKVATKTLGECLELYLAARASGTKPMKATTTADMRKKLSKGMPDLFGMPMKDIDHARIIAWHRDRKLVAPTCADGEARYLRAVWNWTREELPALKLEPWPTSRWSKQKEWSPTKRRTRRLNRQTAPAWMETTRAWSGQRDRALFTLLYYTGWRISEAMSLRWADVDLDHARVILRDTKTHDTYELPLARQSVDALKALERDTEWVFPAVDESGEIVPMVRPGKAIVRHATLCGVDWSAHDLRRGFITVGESIGVPTSAVRRLTGHVVNQRDAHDGYIDFDADDLAPHVQRIADALEGLATGTKGDVVMLPSHPSLAPEYGATYDRRA